jgi:phosphoribosylglycinamide formyltransferase-1
MADIGIPPGHRFVSERIEPIGDSFDTGQMVAGGPGLPRQFRWRGQTYDVAQVLDRWRTTGGCHHGSDERYVRKHWFLIATGDGSEMRIYFDRQPRPGAAKHRWWLAGVRCANAP